MRRLPQALAVLACLYLAIDFASTQNSAASGEPGDIAQLVAWFVGFFLGQFPFWLLRARFHWRLQPLVTVGHRPGQRDNQFSLRSLLAAMAAVAGVLAVWGTHA